MVSLSRGPITYSSPGPSCMATKLAGASCGPLEPPQPERTSSALATAAAGTDLVMRMYGVLTNSLQAARPASDAGSLVAAKGEHPVSLERETARNSGFRSQCPDPGRRAGETLNGACASSRQRGCGES